MGTEDRLTEALERIRARSSRFVVSDKTVPEAAALLDIFGIATKALNASVRTGKRDAEEP